MNFVWTVASMTALAISGLPLHIDISEFEIETDKVNHDLKIIVISDLHNDYYGHNMSVLVNKIIEINPDFILMPGDMFEENHHQERTFQFFEEVKKYPIFYSTGNHEEYRNDLPYMFLRMKKLGIQIPEHQTAIFEKNESCIEILSLPCFKFEESYQLSEINKKFQRDVFRIVLSHRPHWIDLYHNINCDLIVSGHAHGGQWCIPKTRIGMIAPQQGLLPKYIRGLHHLKNNYLLISRGLVHHYHGIPRLFNSPEIVVLKLKAK